MNNIVLETKDLTKTFGQHTAVDSVNITAYEGEVFGFLGPNGAGKTTTLGLVLGLIHATGGEVWVLGERVTPNRVRALKEVGALLGAPAFVPYLSAWDNLDLVGRLASNVNRQRISEVLALVGLSEAARRPVGKFSTGMKQRLGLALALLHRPRFVILDEPTNGLDPAGMREIRQLLRLLVEQGTTVLLSSHLLNEVQQVCDRIAVLNKGRVDDLLNAQKPLVRVTVSDTSAAVRASFFTAEYALVSAGLGSFGHGFEITAVHNDTGLPAQPTQPYSVTITYNDFESIDLIESTLALYSWDGAQWVKEPTSAVDPAHNTVTATPNHFSHWACRS